MFSSGPGARASAGAGSPNRQEQAAQTEVGLPAGCWCASQPGPVGGAEGRSKGSSVQSMHGSRLQWDGEGPAPLHTCLSGAPAPAHSQARSAAHALRRHVQPDAVLYMESRTAILKHPRRSGRGLGQGSLGTLSVRSEEGARATSNLPRGWGHCRVVEGPCKQPEGGGRASP